MKISVKYIFLLLVLAVLFVLIVFAIVDAASNLSAPDAPNPEVGTMNTLEDIYQRIIAGTSAVVHTLNPVSGPAGTMHTLTDIYNAIPSDSAVCSGVNAGTAYCDPTEWSGVILGGSEDWATVKAYCENPVNGYTRLPTASELLKAMAQWRDDASGPGGFVEGNRYWSGTQYDESTAWSVASNSETSISTARPTKLDNSYARCIR